MLMLMCCVNNARTCTFSSRQLFSTTSKEGETLVRSLSNNSSRMERNRDEWNSGTKSSQRTISLLYRDYRIAELTEEPLYNSVKNTYTIDTTGPPPFLFSSASRTFNSRPKVLLTSDIADLARTPFERAGFRVDTITPDITPMFEPLAADCHLFGIGPSTILSESFFRHVGYQPHR